MISKLRWGVAKFFMGLGMVCGYCAMKAMPVDMSVPTQMVKDIARGRAGNIEDYMDDAEFSDFVSEYEKPEEEDVEMIEVFANCPECPHSQQEEIREDTIVTDVECDACGHTFGVMKRT